MMIDTLTSEQGINRSAIAVSVLLHLILFVQLADTTMNSQAQAPNFSTRISLNFLQPVKQAVQTLEPVLKANSVSKSQLKKEITKEIPTVNPELAVASKTSEEIQRGQNKDAAPIKKHYLNNLLTHIEGHKYYPQSARNRGIKGSIDVSFELLNNGEISDLKATGGPMILRKAAEQAIASALPFPVPPTEVNCPLQVSYAMQFQLN